MRVSREETARNRDAILAAASRLFRARGIDDVGVADIAREAGLTHGALYAHFASKAALAAEAFSHGFAGNMASMRTWMADRRTSFAQCLAGLLSGAMRDRWETGCPMAASASEAGRQDAGISERFSRAFEEMTAVVSASIDADVPPAERRRLAVTAVVAHVGAIAVSRAVLKSDPALADEVLTAVRETVRQGEDFAKSPAFTVNSAPGTM